MPVEFDSLKRQDLAVISRARYYPSRNHVVRGYWWEDPPKVLIFFILPVYVLIAIDLLSGPRAIEHVYFDDFYAIAGAVFLVTVAFVCAFGRGDICRTSSLNVEIPTWTLDLIFMLSLVGYLTLMAGVLENPSMILAFFSGGASAFDLLNVKERIVGVTTLTQAVVAYVPMYFYIHKTAPARFNRYQFYLVVLFALTILRSFIFAERLALVETLIPAILIYLRFRRVEDCRACWRSGPYAGILPLIGFFAMNEYHRSWETYYSNLYGNIFEFSAERLGLYYSTALNNGAGILSVLGWGVSSPIFTFDWLVRFPIIGEYVDKFMTTRTAYDNFLNNYADPEFNNPSGIFLYFHEWGWFALGVAVLIGWIFRKSFRGWQRGRGFWCCAHPVLLVSLFEILRVPLIFSGRNFVPIALLFIVFYLIKGSR